MEENEEIKEATFIVREMSQEEEMQRIADLREKAIMDEKAIYAAGIDKGIEQGIELGREEAIKQKNNEIVKRLYKRNNSIVEIAKIVGITEEEVRDILKIK